jgi:DNA polymerase-3 subunit beta
VEIISEWDFCIPSKIFSSFINLSNDDNVEIKLLENENIEIKTQSSDIKIKWVSASEFPIISAITEEKSFIINSKSLKKSIEKTLFSASEWNVRPTLAWIYLNISENLATFASTDSFRLSEFKIKTNYSWEEFSQIIPSKTASELKSILNDDCDIKIIISDNQILFSFENVKLYSRLLNWKFPDYKTFFPTKYNTRAVIDKNELINALKKINLISRENNFLVKINFLDNVITLKTDETQIWEWVVTIQASTEWEEDIIWLNSIYFLEVLWVIDTDHVDIRFESPLSPINILPIEEENKDKDSSFNHIIMPLKI